jgi:branched-chain amino acid transport system permease protein
MNSSWLATNIEILPQLLANSLITGSIYALASAGLALTYGVTRILNFAHGHWMMLGAYIFYAFFSQLEMNLFAASICSFGLIFIIGSISFFAFILPFVGLNSLLPFVSTLALAAILESAVSLVFGVNVLSFSLLDFGQSIIIGSVFITPLQLIIIASNFLVLFNLAILVHTSRFGRSLISLSENSHASEALGIKSKYNIYLCYMLGILLAGLAGVLVAFETNLQPTMGHTYTIKAFAAMILGGLGNIWGTVVGAFVLGLIENLCIGLDFAGYSLPTGYKDAFAFLMILLTLLLRPQGLFGTKSRRI